MIGLVMRPRDPRQLALRKARSRANHRIAFLGHAIVYAGIIALLLVAAGPLVMAIVGLSWGVGLAAHGFFGVVAPLLRDRWVDDEVSRQVETSVGHERRTLGEGHAREMHQLSASLAHEIRNPITAAKSLVQQMGEDPSSEQNVEYAKVAIEELDRVERSISHLLRYAREEDLVMTSIRVNPVIESALEALRDRTEGVELSCSFIEDDQLTGDADGLRRVVLNLVNNALDAVETRESPQITIKSGQSLSGEMWWLSVADNGVGIPAERAEEIFSPFHTDKDKGTGLGLAISKKLVEGHGGTIEVSPGRAEGAELSVTLPRSRMAVSR